MDPAGPCPHPLSKRDAVALVGVLSRLEALLNRLNHAVRAALGEYD